MPHRRALSLFLGVLFHLTSTLAWAQGGWNTWQGKVTMGGNDAFHLETGVYLVISDPSMGLNPTRLKVRNGTKQPITVASPDTTMSPFDVAVGAEREISLHPLKKGQYYTQISVSVRYWQGPTREELAQQQAAAQEKQAQEAKRAAEAQQQETNRRRQLAERAQAQRQAFYDRKMAMVRQRNEQIDQSMSSLAGAMVANMTQTKLQKQNQTIRHNLAQIRDGKLDACQTCDGIGFQDCSCGDGRQSCMACMGQGRVYGGAQCVTCQGSGRQFCMQCGGTLRVECNSCNERGGTPIHIRTNSNPMNQSKPALTEQDWRAPLNLGVAAERMNGSENLKLAMGHFEEALKIASQLYPDGVHENIALTLSNLGITCWNLGGSENQKRSIGYHEAALKIRRRLSPDGKNANLALTLTLLGNAALFGEPQNKEDAIRYYEESLKIRRQLYPDGVHVDIADTLKRLGWATSKPKGIENQQAIGYFEDALKLYRQLYPGSENPAIAGVLSDLGHIAIKRGGADGRKLAIGYFEESREIFRKFPGKSSLIMDISNHLSYCKLFTGDYAKALADAREAISIPGDTFSENSSHTNEATALLLLGREQEARAIYVKFKGERVSPEKTFLQAVIDDFSALRKAGIDHPSFARIETLLKKP